MDRTRIARRDRFADAASGLKSDTEFSGSAFFIAKKHLLFLRLLQPHQFSIRTGLYFGSNFSYDPLI